GPSTPPHRRARVHPVEPEAIRDRQRTAFPFNLNTGRTVEHWHTRTKTGRIPLLESCAPEAWIEITPADAARLGGESHEMVAVESRRGRIDRIRARVTSTVGPGQVFIPFHFAETNVNHL